MAEWADLGVTADPGRGHTEGRLVRATLEDARDRVAALFGIRPRQVVLTSGGTEAINAAVWGTLAGTQDTAPVACAAVEHSAVRDASARRCTVVEIGVDTTGRITAAAVDDALERSVADHGRLPALVHCQAANHEVGTDHDVAEVVAVCHARGVPVHVDAVAAATTVAGVLPYGDVDRRVPHIVCLGVEGVEAEPVLLGLDQAGVAVHSGSSCSSESLEPSPVLEAMGVDGERSLRLSVGWSTTDADVDAFIDAFAGVVGRLRDLRS